MIRGLNSFVEIPITNTLDWKKKGWKIKRKPVKKKNNSIDMIFELCTIKRFKLSISCKGFRYDRVIFDRFSSVLSLYHLFEDFIFSWCFFLLSESKTNKYKQINAVLISEEKTIACLVNVLSTMNYTGVYVSNWLLIFVNVNTC